MNQAVLSLAAVAGFQLLLDAQAPAPGLRMYSPNASNDTYLIDTNNAVVHTWPSSGNPGNGVYVESDGTLIRTLRVTDLIAPNIGGRGGGVQRIAFDGSLLWDYRYATATGWSHHDIAVLPNRNVLLIVWDRQAGTDAIQAGRDPALLRTNLWLPDAIIEVEQTGATTGKIVWEWHMMDHVVQDFDSTKANFGVPAQHPELLNINYPPTVLSNGDWNHCNSISYDPIHDLVILNSPFQNEFWFIDHSTTTAQATGHAGGRYGKGGDFVYRWGNPQAYNRGTAADQKLFFQHGADVIPQGFPGAGNILCFNNRAGTPVNANYSAVVELQLPASFNLGSGVAYGPTGFVWKYTAPVPTDFYSRIVSNAQRLPNGNTLICSGVQKWLFEVTNTGQLVWEDTGLSSYVFQVSYVDRMLWSDTSRVSMSSGGTATLELAAGSPHAGKPYILLGSLAGTTPGITVGNHVLPLNPDLYFQLMLAYANRSPFGNNIGTLDANGRATATVTLPGGVRPSKFGGRRGLRFNHAFAILGSTGGVLQTSNPVPLKWK